MHKLLQTQTNHGHHPGDAICVLRPFFVRPWRNPSSPKRPDVEFQPCRQSKRPFHLLCHSAASAGTRFRFCCTAAWRPSLSRHSAGRVFFNFCFNGI